MTTPDPLQLAAAVRKACVLAALDGYERAQIAGLCQEGAWEAAVDAMRMLDLDALVAYGTAREPAAGQSGP
ncbi:MAG: acetyltransferase [Betaproteobacteria bacterium]|nr:acetyltransferase [Betaproteobacteria bacterium]